MERIYDLWYVKILFGTLLTIIAPLQTTIVIIFVMVFLDTMTGIACAIKKKRFNSRTFKKNFRKIALYSMCILTVRLVEVGALGLSSMALTAIIAGFLIITEAVSILENLTLLGLPVSGKFVNIIFKQIRIGIIQDILEESERKKKELKDIEDILNFQVPNIKEGSIRKILEITVEGWLQVAKEIIIYFDNIEKSDNELIYYKVSSIIQLENKEIEETCKDENIPKETINNFSKWYGLRLNDWSSDMKEVCFRILKPEKKKHEILKRITVLLYQTVIDAQKCEAGLFACELSTQNWEK